MRLITLTTLLLSILISAAVSQTEGKSDVVYPRTDKVDSKGYIHNPTGEIAEEFGIGNIRSMKYAENGTIESINGDLNKGITATDPVEKCYQLFELHKDAFGLVNPREELIQCPYFPSDSDKLTHLAFYLAHNKVKISNILIDIYFDNAGKISGMKGKFYPEVRDLSATPAIDKEKASQIAEYDYKATKEAVNPKVDYIELLFLKENDKLYLAWWTCIKGWCYSIDAITGEIKLSVDAID